MTLGASDIERYSRQILVPEIGGRGQARLLTAKVAIVGDDIAAAVATDLLTRAGIGTGEPADVRVGFGAAAFADTWNTDGPTTAVVATRVADTLCVATLLGRPCPRCIDLGAAPPALRPARGDGSALHLALGALAAGEVLRSLLLPNPTGRLVRLDADGRADVTQPGPTRGCAACNAEP